MGEQFRFLQFTAPPGYLAELSVDELASSIRFCQVRTTKISLSGHCYLPKRCQATGTDALYRVSSPSEIRRALTRLLGSAADLRASKQAFLGTIAGKGAIDSFPSSGYGYDLLLTAASQPLNGY